MLFLGLNKFYKNVGEIKITVNIHYPYLTKEKFERKT